MMTSSVVKKANIAGDDVRSLSFLWGVFVRGVFVQGVFSGGLCPGGFCPDTLKFTTYLTQPSKKSHNKFAIQRPSTNDVSNV